jgi:hypothetical protein
MANLKQRVFAENRNGLIRAFSRPALDFAICSSFLNLWLTSSQMLSKKNIEFAHKYATELRKATDVNDINKQVTLDRIDALRANALARLKKRTETEQRKEDARPKRPVGRPRKDNKPPESKVDGRRKVVEPLPPADSTELLKRLVELQKEKQS